MTMFPLSSHLVQVWKTLAKRNNSTIEKSCIIFKNICWIKNYAAPNSEAEVQVTILPASGNFEISQDSEIIVTGNAKLVEDVDNSKLPLPFNKPIKENTITNVDIYENLTKRGYHKDSFNHLKSSVFNTEFGYIIWKDWLSFIDAIIQFNTIIKNTEAYLIPKYIEMMIIDTKHHDTACIKSENVPVHYFKTIKLIEAGGVQICGMKWDVIHRKLEAFEKQASIEENLETAEETQKELENVHLEVSVPGDLTTLRWVETPALLPTFDTEVCHVYFVGLNRQDIELAYGLPVDEDRQWKSKGQRHFGMEFSGRTASGKRVMGIGQRTLATTVLADKRFLWEVPPHISLMNASTIPMAFMTAYYALVVRGKLKPKQTVLVYDGCSDVGLAAIALANSMNCVIYTTHGSLDQQWHIPNRFISKHHWDHTFERMVVLERTGGRGADVILNQLGHKKVPAAFSCLADHGTLVDIGSDLRRTDLSALSASQSFHSIDMSSITEDEKIQVADLLTEGLRQGHVNHVFYTCFSSKMEDIRRAFEMLHPIGKVIVRMRTEEQPELEQ